MEENSVDEKKKSKIVIIIIALIIIGVGTFLGVTWYLNNNKDKDNKENGNNTVENTEKKAVNIDSIVKLVKDYYYEKDYVKKDNLESWNINQITYYGSVDDMKYYKVEGNYSCLDFTDSCVYLPQVGDKENGLYPFIVYVLVEEKDGKLEIKRLDEIPSSDVKQDDEVYEDDTSSIDNIEKLFKEYYENNKLMDKNNLKELKISNIEYMSYSDKGVTYEIRGSYSCVDGASDCFYVAQNNEPSNGVYDFKLYVLVNNNKIDSIDMLYAEESLDSVFNATGTKEKIVKMVMDFNDDKNLTNHANIDFWAIKTVTLVGYYDTSRESKIYKLEGSYKCLDGSSDCVYLEQVGEKNSDGSYPYVVYADVKNDNGTLVVTNLFGALMNNDFIAINKIVR